MAAKQSMPVERRDRVFLVLIGSISLSLLLAGTFVSGELRGWDIHLEFSVFTRVMEESAWHPERVYGSLYSQSEVLQAFVYDSVLSISILPVMISKVSGLDGLEIFKLVFPAVYSLTPVVLYKVYREIIAADEAFLSVFLFMSFPFFYWGMLGLARQEVAELMLILLLWVLFCTRMNKGHLLCASFLMAGVVVSHYALAYILILVLVVPLVASRLSRRTHALGTSVIVLLGVMLVLSWGLFVAGGASVTSLTRFLSLVFNGLVQDFFNPSSRPTIVMQALGFASVMPGILHAAFRATNYLVQLSLILGFLYLVFARKPSTAAERRMLPLMTMAFLIVASAVLLPFFAEGFDLSRFYHVALIFMSPCFAYGVRGLEGGFRSLHALLRRDTVPVRTHISAPKLAAAALLFSYLLFTSGWVWAVSAERPTSFIFDSKRMLGYPGPEVKTEYLSEYTTASDIAGARWLRHYLDRSGLVCADFVAAYHVLNSYGGLPRTTSKLPYSCDFSTSYVYLSMLNEAFGIGTTKPHNDVVLWPISEIRVTLVAENRIYSNGASTIYRWYDDP